MYLTRNQAGVYSASGVRIPPSPPDCDKPPHGGFFVTGFHERPRRAPPAGIRGKVFSHVFACRPLAPALYPTPERPVASTPASCSHPYFPFPAPCRVLFSPTTALSGTRRFPPVFARRAAHD